MTPPLCVSDHSGGPLHRNRFPHVTQQFVVMSRKKHASGELSPLGARADIVEQLSRLNTGPERDGEDALYGPGIRLDLPPDQDPVTQMLLTVTEEEIAWLVIMRIARVCRWTVLDMETGQEFEPE